MSGEVQSGVVVFHFAWRKILNHAPIFYRNSTRDPFANSMADTATRKIDYRRAILRLTRRAPYNNNVNFLRHITVFVCFLLAP
jgi:hypothetical protein